MLLRMSSLLILLMLFPGCAGLVKSDPIHVIMCPDLAHYDMQTRGAIADELSVLPANGPAMKMISDYLTLRDRCRALSNTNRR